MTVTPLAERASIAQLGSSVRAPRRFDVHTVPSIESQITDARAAGADRVVLDCSDVSFIDVTAVESLVAAGLDDHRDSLRISNPSTAVLVTLELLGHSVVRRPVAA